jgi:hypothetical protein
MQVVAAHRNNDSWTLTVSCVNDWTCLTNTQAVIPYPNAHSFDIMYLSKFCSIASPELYTVLHLPMLSVYLKR